MAEGLGQFFKPMSTKPEAKAEGKFKPRSTSSVSAEESHQGGGAGGGKESFASRVVGGVEGVGESPSVPCPEEKRRAVGEECKREDDVIEVPSEGSLAGGKRVNHGRASPESKKARRGKVVAKTCGERSILSFFKNNGGEGGGAQERGGGGGGQY